MSDESITRVTVETLENGVVTDGRIVSAESWIDALVRASDGQWFFLAIAAVLRSTENALDIAQVRKCFDQETENEVCCAIDYLLSVEGSMTTCMQEDFESLKIAYSQAKCGWQNCEDEEDDDGEQCGSRTERELDGD